VVTAPEVLQVTFNDNSPNYQSIIVSTDNPTFVDNGTTVVRAGLMGTSDDTVSVPLHWVVFPTLTEAQSYTSFSVFPSGTVVEGRNVSGFVDNTNQPYVIDRNQADFDEEVVGVPNRPQWAYASVLYGVEIGSASLANVPDNGGLGTDSNGDLIARSVDNGEAYMRLAADFHGASSQSYGTSTLTLDLVTVD